MTERDETTRPLTAETLVHRLRITASHARRVEEFHSLSNLLDEAADALDAREVQTCSRCKFYQPSIAGYRGWCDLVKFDPPMIDFGCNQWAAKEQP